MPRPKRTNIISAKVVIASPHVAKSPTAHNTKPQLELFPTTPGRVTTGSDDSEGLVKTQRNRVNRKGAVLQEVTMSGALAPVDTGEARVKPLTGRKRAALSRIVRNADHDKAIEALKARRDAALAAEKGTEVLVPSSDPREAIVPIESVAGQHKMDAALDTITVVDAQNPTIEATPRGGAFMLGGSNIKQRPRQPSLLQLVQAQARPQVESEDEDLDDFHPDDESTPFLHAKSQLLTQSSPSPSPASSANQSSSRKRKLSTPVRQVGRSQSLETRTSTPKTPSETPELDLEEDVYNLPFPSSYHNDHPEPSLPILKSPQVLHSKQWSDTCAPPQSSSPSSHDLLHRPLPKRSQLTRNSPSLSSPTSRPLKPLSTATLQNLLPKRRVRLDSREPGPFELPSSSDVEIDTSRLSADADELSVAAKPKLRAKKNLNKTNNQNLKAAKTLTIKKNPPRKGSNGKDNRIAKLQKETPAPKKPKTYARINDVSKINTTASETENESDENDLQIKATSRPPPHTKPTPPATSELQRLARKFQEVDRWELEIEDVTPSSGSQRDAR
jgi:hypothetical protein